METENFSIWSPDAGDQYALTQDLARMADDIDEVLTTVQVVRSGTNAERTAQPYTAYPRGTIWTETDTDGVYLRGAAGWLIVKEPSGPAMVLLYRNNFSASGVINFTNSLTSAYNNYRMLVNIRQMSSPGTVGFRLLNGTTPASGGTDYFVQARSSSGNATVTSGVSQGSAPLTKATVAALYATVDLFDPAVASRTVAIVTSHGIGGDAAAENGSLTIQHNPGNAYNGIQLITSGPGVTGTVAIYGMA